MNEHLSVARPSFRNRLHRRAWLAAALGLGLAFLPGCMVGPNYKRPALPMAIPDHFEEQPQVIQARTWWNAFNDTELDSLIDRAVKANLDLKAAESRIRQARALYTEAAAEEYPQVGVTGEYLRSRSSGALSKAPPAAATGGTGGTVGSPAAASSSGSTDLFQAGFDATWEADVFGGVKRSIEAADYNVQASIEDRRDVMVTLLAEVARAYIDLRGFQRELDIAQQNAKSQRDTLSLTQAKQKAGLSSDLDVAQSESLVYATEATIPTFESNIRASAHVIAVLLAIEPAALNQELLPTGPIPNTKAPAIPLGLPSDLLRRRADVRRAERQLASATANIGVATAQLFPQFSLTGDLGLEGTNSGHVFNWGSRYWSIGPSVSWPVLDWGRLRANVRVQNELTNQAFIVYQQSVLNALSDVDNALVMYSRELARQKSLSDAVNANQRAVDLSLKLYNRGGLIDFLTVLDAERSLFSAQDALVQSQHDESADLVALYKALGGGWQEIEAQERAAAAGGKTPATQPATMPVSMR